MTAGFSALPTEQTSLEDCPGDQKPTAKVRRRKGLYAACLRTYQRVVDSLPDDRVLDRIILRTASRRAVDLLALRATDGRLRYEEIIDRIKERGSSWEALSHAVGGKLDPQLILRLARILALQDLQESDKCDAFDMMCWVHSELGDGIFSADRARLFQGLAFHLGEWDRARDLARSLKLNGSDRRFARADLSNPFGPSPFADAHAWREEFSSFFSDFQLDPPRVDGCNGESEVFDSLTCPTEEWITDGPLVSVIVTAWKPGRGLETAVRSLIDQTWRNLEIIVVDDASPPGSGQWLQRVQGLDPRVKLVPLMTNGGTYLARNAGLAHARGVFVTGQDSDDWSHPRRIELQARKLLKNASLVSTTSHALRCDPCLVFNNPGQLARRENASSLMFRREQVLEKVGRYDATRKGGDTELIIRIQRIFGERSHRTLKQNLALIRSSRGSLSTAEFRPGWRHPARSAYRRAYEYWHATADVQQSNGLLLGATSPSREFPIPGRFRISDLDRYPDCDVVFADDLRVSTGLGHLRALLDEMECAIAAGYSVGVVHLRSFRCIDFERIDTFWAPISKMVQEGRLREVLVSDPVRPRVLIVRRPEVVQFLAHENVELRPEHIIVACEERIRAGGQVWFEPVSCGKNIRRAFDPRSVEWRAEGRVAKELAAALPDGTTIGPAYPLILDTSAWRVPSRDFGTRRPAVGTLLTGDLAGEPVTAASLLAAYPPTGKLPMRFLGDEDQCREKLKGRSIPASWSFYPVADTDFEVFLSSCDFFVLFSSAHLMQVHRTLAQAMASGCVVITAEENAAVFGDAVIAVDSSQVLEVVQRLKEDPARFHAQVRKGWAYCQALNDISRLASPGSPVPRALKRSARDVSLANQRQHAPGVMSDLVRRAEANEAASGRLDATILRTGSVNGRQLLAWGASDGCASLDEILRLAEGARAPGRRAAVEQEMRQLDPGYLIRLARVLILQCFSEEDRLNGLTLCELVLSQHGPRAVAKNMSKVFFDAAIRTGRIGFARYLYENLDFTRSNSMLASIDLAHPDLSGGTESAWLGQLNQLFAKTGLEPISLEASESVSVPVFDRLSIVPTGDADVVDGPLVTVVITAWRPTLALITSLRSVLAQTWRNLEVLIVDDASPGEFREVFDRCLSMDSRVRLLRHELNRGTYVARNTALSVAKGEFVTFQDSDDFSHRRRIELQLEPLRNSTEVVASRSSSLRVDDRLILANPGSAAIQANASSLLFRRREVLERIGFFDSVRKGADNEYSERIKASFGAPVFELDVKLPLALIRLESNSLSRAEFKPGWRHPARSAYRESYENWHRMIESGNAVPFVSPELDEHRAFPAPLRFHVERMRKPEVFDVVFVSDWRQYGGPQKSMIEEIKALRSRGLRIGVCHMEAYRFMTNHRRPLCQPVRDLIHQGVVAELVTSDAVDIRMVILRYPLILQFHEAGRVAWRLGRLVLVANQAPNELDGTDVRYSVSDCMQNAKTLFGAEPLWTPQGPHVRAALEPLLPAAAMDPRDTPGILEMKDSPSAVRPFRGRRPVIGRYSRDNLLKFPDTPERLREAYMADEDVDVLIMGGSTTCTQLLGDGQVPENWTLLPYGHMDVADFLDQIDFFVYFDSDRIVEAFGRSILEAICSGCVVILPHKFREVFGAGAMYCAAEGVSGIVNRLYADPEAYQAQRMTALGHARDVFSHDSYADRIGKMLDAIQL